MKKCHTLLMTILYCACAVTFSYGQSSAFAGYRIGPSDVLLISVWQQPDLSREVTVRPDGAITYPLLGDIPVAGMSTLELRDMLAEALQEYVNIMVSEVTISVEQVNSYTVSVLGEVKTPGRFNFQNQATVLDALAEAGGFTAFASSNRIIILRTENGQVTRIPFNYRSVTRGRNAPPQLLVYPGDIIMVP